MSLADSPRTQPLKPLDISVEDVDDAQILDNQIILLMKSGEILRLPAEKPEARHLYWQVKIRNRRRAFGL